MHIAHLILSNLQEVFQSPNYQVRHPRRAHLKLGEKVVGEVQTETAQRLYTLFLCYLETVQRLWHENKKLIRRHDRRPTPASLKARTEYARVQTHREIILKLFWEAVYFQKPTFVGAELDVIKDWRLVTPSTDTSSPPLFGRHSLSTQFFAVLSDIFSGTMEEGFLEPETAIQPNEKDVGSVADVAVVKALWTLDKGFEKTGEIYFPWMRDIRLFEEHMKSMSGEPGSFLMRFPIEQKLAERLKGQQQLAQQIVGCVLQETLPQGRPEPMG